LALTEARQLGTLLEELQINHHQTWYYRRTDQNSMSGTTE
jgi:hypothetical protein